MILRCLLSAIIFLPFISFSQAHESAPRPKDGLERLALFYLTTDFTQEQRSRLRDIPLELIFFVDSAGVAVLEDVNGISDPFIIDSLTRKRDVPIFHPAVRDGLKTDGLFFMLLEFPSYPEAQYFSNRRRFGSFRMDELEYIERSGHSIHLTFGGVVNSFVGNPSRYLSTGGGFEMETLWQSPSNYLFGANLSMYSNHAREFYPINTTREMDSAPTSFRLGLCVGRELLAGDRRTIHLLLDFAYAGQTVSSRVDADDEDYIQLNGFSPGVLVHYFVPVWGERFRHGFSSPTVVSHFLNFHAAARPMFLDLKEARGMMFEFGVSLRMKAEVVREYRFRP